MPRKPRNLHEYGNKETALAFLDELREMVEREPDRIRIRIKATYTRWDPNWEKKDGRVGK